MRQSDILASTYHDLCSIYRDEEIRVGNITRHEKNVCVSENVSCALSKGTSKISGDVASRITDDHKLFVTPDTDIKKGDLVKVVQKGCSNATSYIAKQPFLYSGSHIEVDLEREDYE